MKHMQFATGGIRRKEEEGQEAGEGGHISHKQEYDLLLDEAIKLGRDHRRKAKYYVPKMYQLLAEREGLDPPSAASKIYQDLAGIWQKDTIRRLLPVETKDQAARERQALSRIKLGRSTGLVLRQDTENTDKIVHDLRKENERLNRQVEELERVKNSHLEKILHLERALNMQHNNRVQVGASAERIESKKVVLPPHLFFKAYMLLKGSSRPLVLRVSNNEVQDVERLS
jgi:predicted RNase H-like nuclease (RuvC/YqgF family)